jgi:hypothetical protein
MQIQITPNPTVRAGSKDFTLCMDHPIPPGKFSFPDLNNNEDKEKSSLEYSFSAKI